MFQLRSRLLIPPRRSAPNRIRSTTCSRPWQGLRGSRTRLRTADTGWVPKNRRGPFSQEHCGNRHGTTCDDFQRLGGGRYRLRTNPGPWRDLWPAWADSEDQLGSTAAQIARTLLHWSRHIEHGGPAHGDAELQNPMAAAHQRLPDGYPQAAERRTMAKMTGEIMVKPRCR